MNIKLFSYLILKERWQGNKKLEVIGTSCKNSEGSTESATGGVL